MYALAMPWPRLPRVGALCAFCNQSSPPPQPRYSPESRSPSLRLHGRRSRQDNVSASLEGAGVCVCSCAAQQYTAYSTATTALSLALPRTTSLVLSPANSLSRSDSRQRLLLHSKKYVSHGGLSATPHWAVCNYSFLCATIIIGHRVFTMGG